VNNQILIVHPDGAFIEALKSRLDDIGFQAYGVSRGSQIFPLLSRTQPGAILLDVELTSPSWEEIIKRLRQSESYRKIIFVLMVRNKNVALEHQAKLYRVKAVIKKPIVFRQIVAVLKALIED